MSSEEITYILPDLDVVIEEIGKGGYGKVHLVEHDGEIVARKMVDFGETVFIESNGKEMVTRELQLNTRTKSIISSAIEEIEKINELYHINVIELVDYYIDAENYRIYIYSKWYKNGDLSHYVQEIRNKNEDFSLSVYFLINILFIGDN